MGRCLDDLYDYGVTNLFSQISGRACEILGLDKGTQTWHLDSTSFHVDGKYNRNLKAENISTIQINKGYSRDHRPDLNQVILNMIVEQKAGISLYMQALSGNTNDKTSFQEMVEKHVLSLEVPSRPIYLVADSALYTANTISSLSLGGQTWLTRVPATIQEVQNLTSCVDVSQMHSFEDKSLGTYRYICVGSTYGEVRQEWMIVHSAEAHKEEVITLSKNYARQSTQEAKGWTKLAEKLFTCQKDAQDALDDFKKKMKYLTLHEAKVEAVWGYKGQGRPKKEQEKVILGYQIQGSFGCEITHFERLCAQKGIFIIATNDIIGTYTPDERLLAYKNKAK